MPSMLPISKKPPSRLKRASETKQILPPGYFLSLVSHSLLIHHQTAMQANHTSYWNLVGNHFIHPSHRFTIVAFFPPWRHCQLPDVVVFSSPSYVPRPCWVCMVGILTRHVSPPPDMCFQHRTTPTSELFPLSRLCHYIQ